MQRDQAQDYDGSRGYAPHGGRVTLNDVLAA
jgi:hypothetical protein